MFSPDSFEQRAADMAVCAALIRQGSKSFHAASLLLPAQARNPAYALYSFCRIADDEVDLFDHDGDAVDRLQERLRRIYEGTPIDAPTDRAFADVVQTFGIPRDLPEALIEGLAWDTARRRYESLDDLEAYAARVASAVGAMMTLLMGVRDPSALARACDLGVAMQLTNIARDVGEDARNGRIYLPLIWLREAGIDPDVWLRDPQFSGELACIVERLLQVADERYKRAVAGMPSLPILCRSGIYVARLLYAEIGHEVRRRGHDSVSQRAVVSGWRKAALLLRAPLILAIAANARHFSAPASAPTHFLVDAVSRAPQPFGYQRQMGFVDARIARLVELFTLLDERERPLHLTPPRR